MVPRGAAPPPRGAAGRGRATTGAQRPARSMRHPLSVPPPAPEPVAVASGGPVPARPARRAGTSAGPAGTGAGVAEPAASAQPQPQRGRELRPRRGGRDRARHADPPIHLGLQTRAPMPAPGKFVTTEPGGWPPVVSVPSARGRRRGRVSCDAGASSTPTAASADHCPAGATAGTILAPRHLRSTSTVEPKGAPYAQFVERLFGFMAAASLLAAAGASSGSGGQGRRRPRLYGRRRVSLASEDRLAGLEIYLKLNADKIKPYAIKLIKRDEKDPAGANTKIAVQELLAQENVDILAGWNYSPNAIRVGAGRHRRQEARGDRRTPAPRISPTCRPTSCGCRSACGMPATRWARLRRRQLKAKTAVIGYSDLPARQGQPRRFQARVRSQRRQVIDEIPMGGAGTVPDFTPFLQRAKDKAGRALRVRPGRRSLHRGGQDLRRARHARRPASS